MNNKCMKEVINQLPNSPGIEQLLADSRLAFFNQQNDMALS